MQPTLIFDHLLWGHSFGLFSTCTCRANWIYCTSRTTGLIRTAILFFIAGQVACHISILILHFTVEDNVLIPNIFLKNLIDFDEITIDVFKYIFLHETRSDTVL
jgi:hypothetical protein